MRRDTYSADVKVYGLIDKNTVNLFSYIICSVKSTANGGSCGLKPMPRFSFFVIHFGATL